MPVERARVLGVPVDLVTTSDLLEIVRRRIGARDPAFAVTVNVEYIVRAQSNPTFRALLERADVATPDSVGVLWALRRQGFNLEGRVGGSDLVWTIPEQAARLGHRLFLLGAAPGVADEAGRRLTQRFPALLLAGTHAGSPAPDDDDTVVDLIRRSKADIVFVAYGSPHQDFWIARNLRRTGASFAMGVGGSLDYLAGTARRAPIWMQERGVEWLWRLSRQPRRWRRMLAIPKFMWLVWREPRGDSRRERTGG